MAKITIHSQGKVADSDYQPGMSLLSILQNNGYEIPAACGGAGVCGKCKVRVQGLGLVNSCTWYPDTDIEVIIPGPREAKILTDQYQHSRTIKLQPPGLSLQVGFPVGLGIDIGTTTVVYNWVNLITGGLMRSTAGINPQSSYGADVISRINYCTSEDKVKRLQAEIIGAINSQVKAFILQEQITENEIVKISVSGNTTMLHLLAGENPTSIAQFPFTPVFTEARKYTPPMLGIKANPDADIHLLPSLSAYVGADIVAGLASLKPVAGNERYLFIDIGTNGEMALVTDEKIYCCATAAGPAFEGANISCGMGAFDGAISVYDKEGYKTISEVSPVGICGSGLLDSIAFMLKENIIGSEGLLEEDFVLADSDESGNGEALSITPADVREVQLAKSAIFTGIKILLSEAGCNYNDIDKVYLAGGFGNYMNPESAIGIGMLPSAFAGRILTVGNTSGAGAMMHVLSDEFMSFADEILKKSELVELASHPDFEMEFAMNMFF